MKLTTIISTLALVGCAGSPPQPHQPVGVVHRAPATVSVVHDDWSLTLPEGWRTRSLKDFGTLSMDPTRTIAVVVQTIELGQDDPPDAVFGDAVALTLFQVDDITVLNAGPRQVDARPGSMAILRINETGGTVVQYAVGANRKGYVVACGGQGLSAIVKACEPILDTFHIEK
jgi:hypothetical protein